MTTSYNFAFHALKQEIGITWARIGLDSWSRLNSLFTKILWRVHDTMFNIPWNFQGNWLPRSYKIQALKPMLNSYQLNDKFPTDVQPVYVTTCMTPGFFQNLWRTIGDAIFYALSPLEFILALWCMGTSNIVWTMCNKYDVYCLYYIHFTHGK